MTSLRVLRVTAAAAASDVIDDMDGLDALRLAVDELAIAIIDAAVDGSDLELRIESDGDGVSVSGRAPADGVTPSLSDISATLVASGTSAYELRGEGSTACFEATFPTG